jgi:NTP pyrophosphatase (non-canonical NTP hydrolase)
MFGQYEDDFDSESQADRANLIDAVLNQLPTNSLVDFSDVAEALGEVPWDVLMVCRQLTRKGLAREGVDKQRGSFGRI